MKVLCPHCGEQYDVDDSYSGCTVACSSCHRDFSVPERSEHLAGCPDCGKSISKRATSCPHCGGPINTTPPQTPDMPLSPKLTACLDCGATMSKRASFCPRCGGPKDSIQSYIFSSAQSFFSAGAFILGFIFLLCIVVDLVRTHEPIMQMTGAALLGFALLLSAIALKK